MKSKIIIGCDHAGVDFKNQLIEYLSTSGYDVEDVGCYDNNSVDYPDIAELVCNKLKATNDPTTRGILICGTGIGISIAANKINGIRAALCHDCLSATHTRLHNDSNVICFGARVIGVGLAIDLTNMFLTTEFEGGRHQIRLDKLMKLQ